MPVEAALRSNRIGIGGLCIGGAEATGFEPTLSTPGYCWGSVSTVSGDCPLFHSPAHADLASSPDSPANQEPRPQLPLNPPDPTMPRKKPDPDHSKSSLIGVRFLLGDIALLQGDHQAAMKEYLAGAPNSPAHWYQAALIAFREGDYVAACTYLRRGIATNHYIAEGLTGRTVLSEHLYRHASNVHGPEWAVDYLDSAACDWTPEEIDFVDWVFNASPVLKERAEMMALHEGMTYERDTERRAPYAQRSLDFIGRIPDTLSKKIVRKVKHRWDVEIWPWDRDGFQRQPNKSLQ